MTLSVKKNKGSKHNWQFHNNNYCCQRFYINYCYNKKYVLQFYSFWLYLASNPTVVPVLSSDSVMVSVSCDANNAHWRKKIKKKKKFWTTIWFQRFSIILKLFTIQKNESPTCTVLRNFYNNSVVSSLNNKCKVM